MAASRVLRDFHPGDARLVEWDFRSALPLLLAATRDAEPRLCPRPEIPIPFRSELGRQQRDVAFFSDVSAGYYYSRQVMRAKPLTEALRQLLDIVNGSVGAKFNGVLVNKYRTGHDTVGSHADSEFALDASAGVISLSVGATRLFRIRTRNGEKVGDFDAREGYGLQMRGSQFQSLYKHEIPQQKRIRESRVSFTFRTHLPEQEGKLWDLIHKQASQLNHNQECEVERHPRSRSPRRESAVAEPQKAVVFRLIGAYRIPDRTLIDNCVAYIVQRATVLPGDRQVVIAWDGDNYMPDNFTKAIPYLRAALPTASFVAFKLASNSAGGRIRCPRGFRSARGVETAPLPRMHEVAYDGPVCLDAGTFIGVCVPVGEAKTFSELGFAAMRWLCSQVEAKEIVVVRTGNGRMAIAEASASVISQLPPEVEVSYVAM